ncbi:MAG: transporter substrate-binding domain-containing protein [Acidimicrobiia bacterium]
MSRRWGHPWPTIAVGAVLAAACTSAPAAGPVPGAPPEASVTTLALGEQRLLTRVPGVLTIAVERPAPPFYVAGADGGTTGGFEYDLARAIATRLGVRTVRVVEAPVLALTSGQDCRCDLMLSQVAITAALAQRVDFTVPYLKADHGVLVRAGTRVRTAEAARRLRWAFVLDDDVARAAVGSFEVPLTPTPFLTVPAAVAALAAGDVDVVLVETPLAMAAADAGPGLRVVGRVPTGVRYAAILPLGSPDTAVLNDAIAALEAEGTIGELAREYFMVEPTALMVLPWLS